MTNFFSPINMCSWDRKYATSTTYVLWTSTHKRKNYSYFYYFLYLVRQEKESVSRAIPYLLCKLMRVTASVAEILYLGNDKLKILLHRSTWIDMACSCGKNVSRKSTLIFNGTLGKVHEINSGHHCGLDCSRRPTRMSTFQQSSQTTEVRARHWSARDYIQTAYWGIEFTLPLPFCWWWRHSFITKWRVFRCDSTVQETNNYTLSIILVSPKPRVLMQPQKGWTLEDELYAGQHLLWWGW